MSLLVGILISAKCLWDHPGSTLFANDVSLLEGGLLEHLRCLISR
jgi:hypothetical protein